KEQLLLRLVASGAPSASASTIKPLPTPLPGQVLTLPRNSTRLARRLFEWGVLGTVAALFLLATIQMINKRSSSPPKTAVIAPEPELSESVVFDTVPYDAEVAIDGRRIDRSQPVNLEWNEHDVAVSREFHLPALVRLVPYLLEGRRAFGYRNSEGE